MHTVRVNKSDWQFVLIWKTKSRCFFEQNIISHVISKPGMGLFMSWSAKDFEYNLQTN